MSKKILIVDDDPSIMLLCRKYLESQGYKVSTASDGLDALAQIKAGKPDLIIMDILMPRLDGYQTAEKIRAMGGDYRTLPLIIITVKEKLDVLFENLSIQCFLTKPFKIEELGRQVELALKPAAG